MTHEPEPIRATEAGAILTVDLGALAANWKLLDAHSGAAECAAVVKADAYGVGLEPAARALWQAGARTFFVAHAYGGRKLRETLPAATIYCLNGFAPGAVEHFIAHRLRPVIGSLEEAKEWRQAALGRSDAQPAAVHLDTGMNRLGLETDELGPARALLESVPLALVMSHFASSEQIDDPFNTRQIETFEQMRQAFPDLPCSIANSSGAFLRRSPHYDLVRPGYALYGGNPTPGETNPMQSVVSLDARIVQTRFIEAGETVGYNAIWRAPERRRLATISLGYADGMPRALVGENGAQGGEAVVAGVRCPFVGRVSMDLIVLDVTDAPRAERGDFVEILGPTISIDELGARARTIGYEILTNLGRRYARVYRGG